MQNYRQAFIEFAISQGVLKLGEFTLKSDRISPYFFNAGLFNNGQGISKLGRYYAQAIIESDIKFDVVFGPAYKGISLAIATAIALAEQHGKNISYAYNRKEPKAYGEGGSIVGGPLEGKVLIIDDVITAGTAVRASLQLINAAGAEPVGVLISLDREERGTGAESAVQEVEQQHGIPVHSIAKLTDLLEFMREKEEYQQYVQALEAYHAEYGI